jgi:hypothetical protein
MGAEKAIVWNAGNEIDYLRPANMAGSQKRHRDTFSLEASASAVD